MTVSSPTLQADEEATQRKREEMLTQPIGPLILHLGAPSVVANIVTTIYNLADSFFIGQISTAAEGAVGVAFFVMTLIQGIGFYFGQGTGNALGRYLGKDEREQAQRMATAGLALSFGFGVILAVVGTILLEPICRLAGATETILPHAKAYMSLILIGAPWMAASLTANFQLRMEGESFWSMVALVTGAVLDFLLDPIFIFVLHMDIAGAALATIICELISFLMIVISSQKLGVAPYDFRLLKIDGDLLREINNGGLPSLARQMVSGVATVALNHAAQPFGDAAIAAMAIVSRVSSVGNYVQIGIGQGFQSLCGYNYGAGRGDRVRKGYFFAVRACIIAVAAVSAMVFVFAPQIAATMRNDPEVVAIATVALRFQAVTLPITGIAMITNFMLQTTGRMWRALFLGLARLGIVLAPMVTLLPLAFGLLGVEMAQSAADVVTVCIAVPMARIALRELGVVQPVE